MLAFVLNGDVASAIAGVAANVRRLNDELAMDVDAGFARSSVLPDDDRLRETYHVRVARADPITVHHLFMPVASIEDASN